MQKELQRSPQTLNDVSRGSLLHFGDYELLEEIARGGMGVVFRARQLSLNRIVAVKMLLLGKFASDPFVKRFRQEAQAVAGLQHPNIVAIHEIGEHDGQPYFSMDYVAGKDLAAVMREGPIPVRRAVKYIQTVAEAIHHAHQQGILHRDLKPSNILIDESGAPRVTDFGLAKQLKSDSHLTTSGQVLGSPSYMSPEQAKGNRSSITATSDVYSLGAILYHLLTGRPPFLAETLEATLLQLSQNDPVNLRLLNPGLPRDLETICLKALERDPQQRYESALALAEDLQRYLAGEPIRARPAGAAERCWRWCRRKPAQAIALGLLTLLTVGSILAAAHFKRMEASMAKLREAERIQRYVVHVSHAFRELQQGNRARVVDLLEQERQHPGETDVRGFEWRYLWRLAFSPNVQSLPVHNQVVGDLRFSPDGRWLQTFAWDNTLRVWDWKVKRNVLELTNAASLGVFSEDNDALVAGDTRGNIFRYQLESDEHTCLLTNAGRCVASSANGRVIATLDDHQTIHLRNSETFEVQFSIPGTASPFLDSGYGTPVALGPDGRLVAVVQPFSDLRRERQEIRIWDTIDKTELPRIAEPAAIHCLRFCPDGRLAIGNNRGEIKLWNLATRETTIIHALALPVESIAFTPNGLILAAGCNGQPMKLWDITTGLELERRVPGQFHQAASLAFAPDGKTVACGSRNSPVWIWNPDAKEPPDTVHELLSHEWGNIAFSPDGRLIAAGCKRDRVKVWNVADLSIRAELPGASFVVAFSPDGRRLLVASGREEPKWWNLDTGVSTPIPNYPGLMTGKISAADVTSDQRMAVLGHKDGTLELLEITTGREIARWKGHHDEVMSVAFAPGGEQLVSGGRDRWLRTWEVATQRNLGENEEHKGAVCTAAYSRNGSQLASGCGAGTIKLWNPFELNQKASFSISYHPDAIRALAFSTDGWTLASGDDYHMVKLWNVKSGDEIASFPQDGRLRLLAFSPDGNCLATVTDAGTLRLYRACSREEADAESRSW